ncbi:MAG: hypothetical protein ACRDQ4_09975 [Pseudonocardiaceae bacterium]
MTGQSGRRAFGATWWGTAWLIALEKRARLDPSRLSRGRGYARRGTVDALEIMPGLVRANVQGSRDQPYQVTVRVRELDVSEWDRVGPSGTECSTPPHRNPDPAALLARP